MAYKIHNKDLLTNVATIVRREWIESAIAGARARLDEPLPVAESANSGIYGGGFREEAIDSSGPHLTLVWSADERRSGT